VPSNQQKNYNKKNWQLEMILITNCWLIQYCKATLDTGANPGERLGRKT